MEENKGKEDVDLDADLQKQILRGIRVLLTVAAICMILYFAIPLIYPFLIGLIIAYLLNPAVNWLQREAHLPRWASVLAALIVFFGAAAGFLTFLITKIVVEIGTFSELVQRNLNGWINQGVGYFNSPFIQDIISQLNFFYDTNPQYQNTINNNLSATAKSLADAGSTLIGVILNGIVGFITSLPSVATLTVIALLAAFFISKDWFRLSTRMACWMPHNMKKSTRAIWRDLQKALFGYVRAQLILISLTALVVIIGLLVLGVKYAVTIGLLIGLVDLMPYLGTGAAMIPWIIVVFLQGNVYLGVGLSILYGIILVARQILEPKVLATSIGLDPLATLIALFVGLKLFGVIGLILGPVSLVVLSAFHRANVFRDIYRYIRSGPSLE